MAIGTSEAFFSWKPRSGCTVLAEVPLDPNNPYFRGQIFPNLDAKLAANQDRFNRDLHQGIRNDNNIDFWILI